MQLSDSAPSLELVCAAATRALARALTSASFLNCTLSSHWIKQTSRVLGLASPIAASNVVGEAMSCSCGKTWRDLEHCGAMHCGVVGGAERYRLVLLAKLERRGDSVDVAREVRSRIGVKCWQGHAVAEHDHRACTRCACTRRSLCERWLTTTREEGSRQRTGNLPTRPAGLWASDEDTAVTTDSRPAAALHSTVQLYSCGAD